MTSTPARRGTAPWATARPGTWWEVAEFVPRRGQPPSRCVVARAVAPSEGENEARFDAYVEGEPERITASQIRSARELLL